MVANSTETPDLLRAYTFHGMALEVKGSQAVGDCPFCGKEERFYINKSTGQSDCKRCAWKGNVFTFLRSLWEHGKEAHEDQDYTELARDRKLVGTKPLEVWGMRSSILTYEWLVPGFCKDGKLIQLYRYTKSNSGKMRLFATPELKHGLHGVDLYDAKKPIVMIVEGPFDAMCLWEVLAHAKGNPAEGFEITDNIEESYLSQVNILAVPGCNVWNDSWSSLLAGKDVILLFDNDHPKKHPRTGVMQPPAGFEAMHRLSEALVCGEEKPRSISYLPWGEGEENYEPLLPSGYDIRDVISEENTIQARVGILGELLSAVIAIPSEWIQARTEKAKENGGMEIELLPCHDWKTLQNQWRKAMNWFEGLDVALSVMLSAIVSTRAVGEQLWIKVVSPPSAGKSELCEALSVNKKYITAKSTLRGFYSGAMDKGDDTDHSLIAQLYNKTLVTKDGDTLLNSPNLGQILSEARDLYDTVGRTSYRNPRASRDYTGIRMTWILCGTSSLRQLDNSELGERFLDCVIMDTIDDDLENEILWRVVNQADNAMKQESNGRLDSHYPPEKLLAMQLTGGYVTHLRENAQHLIAEVQSSDESKLMCAKLGKFVAFMRARPSSKQEESAEREASYRLAKQLTRLARCLAVVLNKPSIDAEVMARVRKVALDTARGRTMDIARVLYKGGDDGVEVKGLTVVTSETWAKLSTMLRFLRKIKAAEMTDDRRPRWKLTPVLHGLYGEIVEDVLCKNKGF